jgi:hypothetical protein
VLVPGAQPRWAADAVGDADIVVLSTPLHRFADLDPALVAGKLVVDAMNYWPPVNGVLDMFEDRRYSSSEIVQRRLAQSTVVKTLNHIGYHRRIGKSRGFATPTKEQFLHEVGPHGALYIGSPETVAQKIRGKSARFGSHPFRFEVRDGRPVARSTDDEHRALRHQGHSTRPGAVGLTRIDLAH